MIITVYDDVDCIDDLGFVLFLPPFRSLLPLQLPDTHILFLDLRLSDRGIFPLSSYSFAHACPHPRPRYFKIAINVAHPTRKLHTLHSHKHEHFFRHLRTLLLLLQSTWRFMFRPCCARARRYISRRGMLVCFGARLRSMTSAALCCVRPGGVPHSGPALILYSDAGSHLHTPYT